MAHSSTAVGSNPGMSSPIRRRWRSTTGQAMKVPRSATRNIAAWPPLLMPRGWIGSIADVISPV